MPDVINFPDALKRRAEAVKRALNRRNTAEGEWVKGTLDLCVELAGARAEFANDRDFGRWCAEHDFGENTLPKNERAILVQWGEKPDWTRTVLEKTARDSIEHIHRNEWKVTHVRNHQDQIGIKPAPKRETAKAYAQAYEAEMGVLPSYKQVTRGTGVSAATVDEALRDLRSRRSGEDGPIHFTRAQDAHIEARIKILTKKLEAEFAERVRLSVLERNADYLSGLERLQKQAAEKCERYENLVNNWKAVFTDAEYTIILSCVHPDNSASKERRELAFQTLQAKKFQLTGKR